MAFSLPAEIDVGQLGSVLQKMVTELVSAPMPNTLEKCRDMVARGIDHNFLMEQNYSGGQWPPHAPKTVAMYGPHPLLILSGAMFESVTMVGAPFNVYEPMGNGRGFAWGTNIIYAATHQYGDDSRNIPEREFVYIDYETEFQIGELIEEDGIMELIGI